MSHGSLHSLDQLDKGGFLAVSVAAQGDVESLEGSFDVERVRAGIVRGRCRC